MNRQNALRLTFPGPAPLGAGALKARPGAYQIAEDWNGVYGIPGPREVADLTGIAANFRVYQMLKHADVLFAVTSDGTDTKVYRKETGAWAEKATITGRVPFGPQSAVSFKDVLAIGFVSGAYYYSTNIAGGTYTFVASTKTSNHAAQAWHFCVQSNGLLTSRVAYMVLNEFYVTEDLTNTDGVGINATYIGDTSSTQNYATSICEEPGSPRLLIGMRHALYTIHQEPSYDGIFEKLTEDFPDPPPDAGGQSDRYNFENPQLVAGMVVYPIVGYDCLLWRGAGQPYDRYFAPRWVSDCKLPRADLPINTMVSVAGGAFLLLFMGSKNTSTLKDITYWPGGNAHIAAQFTTNSEMWIGQPTDNGMVWHGVALRVSNPLRYAFWDEDDAFLYMASGDAETVNLQMTRCTFPVDNPLNHPATLNNGGWKVEYGALDFGDEWTTKRWEHFSTRTLGLASTVPSLTVEYKVTPEDDTAAFQSFTTFTDGPRGRMGEEFPQEVAGETLHIRLSGTGTGNTYTELLSWEIRAQLAPDQDQAPRRR